MTVTAELAPTVGIAGACRALGVSRASFYRRQQPTRLPSIPIAPSVPTPRRASPRSLSPTERQNIRETLNSSRFVDQAPAQIHTALLDEGEFLCSTRTMYRILDEAQEVRERRDQLRHPTYHKPELIATGPNQVWSWDITMLPGPAKASRFHLYVILDIFSRYVVGWLLAQRECQDLAARLIRETCQKQNIKDDQLTIHSDRGPSMKSQTVAQLLAALGAIKSHSRPHVSNDNPFSESQFKTLKYRPEFPARFASYDEARAFCAKYFPWYNDEHYHSGLQMFTPVLSTTAKPAPFWPNGNKPAGGLRRPPGTICPRRPQGKARTRNRVDQPASRRSRLITIFEISVSKLLTRTAFRSPEDGGRKSIRGSRGKLLRVRVRRGVIRIALEVSFKADKMIFQKIFCYRATTCSKQRSKQEASERGNRRKWLNIRDLRA